MHTLYCYYNTRSLARLVQFVASLVVSLFCYLSSIPARIHIDNDNDVDVIIGVESVRIKYSCVKLNRYYFYFDGIGINYGWTLDGWSVCGTCDERKDSLEGTKNKSEFQRVLEVLAPAFPISTSTTPFREDFLLFLLFFEFFVV